MGAAERMQAIKQLRAQPRARGKRIVAPVGGLNARDAWASMPETDAIILDNMFVQPTWVEIRGGRAPLATFSGNGETLIPYNGLAAGTTQMFCAVNNAGTRSIFRVDNAGGGAVGAAVVGGGGATIQAITGCQYDYGQLGTAALDALVLVNGLDNPLIFDGTTWYSITTVSAPYAWTGGPTPLTSLNQVAVYKNRFWFVQAGTFNVYYLPQNVFAGAMTLLQLGALFKLGGYIQTMITVSIDNASGTNDYIAFVSNQGEVIVFSGYDPGSVATWSESAHFRVGRPVALGRRAWQKLGSDAVMIGADGYVLISEALLTDRSQQKDELSDKIRKSVTDDMSLYSANPGWQVILYPIGNKVLVNVGTSAALGTSYTYVMNTLNQAWSTWGKYASPLNAFHYEVWKDNLYYATNGSVQQCDLTTYSDAGAPITWTVKPAFSYYDDTEHLKRPVMCQPIFQVNGNLSVSMITNVDFDITLPTGTVPISTANLPQWGVALWGSAWGDQQQIVKPWVGLQGEGYCVTITMQGATNGLYAKWQATNFLYEPGGMFYGIG